MFAKALALALVLAAPILAQRTSFLPAGCTRTYTVQSGDICDGISAANNVSTYQLAVVNQGIIDDQCDNLSPGSTLCLGTTGEDCTDTYVVQLGDTCDYVTGMKNINETIFYNNNPQIDWACGNMYVGEVVCVASTVLVPPTPSGPLPGSNVPPTSVPADDGDLPYCDEM